MVGRSLRAVVDLAALGPRTIWLDCDVLQADGGTRTASITGAYVALVLAVQRLVADGALEQSPVRTSVAAISAGMVDGRPLLDLCYAEDAAATVDMNIVMTGTGEYVELQGSGEESTFQQVDLDRLLKLSAGGIRKLTRLQAAVLKR